jgi:hypothetical protein
VCLHAVDFVFHQFNISNASICHSELFFNQSGAYVSAVNELIDVNPLLAINEIVLKKKKIISMKEHYDQEDRNGM